MFKFRTNKLLQKKSNNGKIKIFKPISMKPQTYNMILENG